MSEYTENEVVEPELVQEESKETSGESKYIDFEKNPIWDKNPESKDNNLVNYQFLNANRHKNLEVFSEDDIKRATELFHVNNNYGLNHRQNLLKELSPLWNQTTKLTEASKDIDGLTDKNFQLQWTQGRLNNMVKTTEDGVKPVEWDDLNKDQQIKYHIASELANNAFFYTDPKNYNYKRALIGLYAQDAEAAFRYRNDYVMDNWMSLPMYTRKFTHHLLQRPSGEYDIMTKPEIHKEMVTGKLGPELNMINAWGWREKDYNKDAHWLWYLVPSEVKDLISYTGLKDRDEMGLPIWERFRKHVEGGFRDMGLGLTHMIESGAIGAAQSMGAESWFGRDLKTKEGQVMSDNDAIMLLQKASLESLRPQFRTDKTPSMLKHGGRWWNPEDWNINKDNVAAGVLEGLSSIAQIVGTSYMLPMKAGKYAKLAQSSEKLGKYGREFTYNTGKKLAKNGKLITGAASLADEAASISNVQKLWRGALNWQKHNASGALLVLPGIHKAGMEAGLDHMNNFFFSFVTANAVGYLERIFPERLSKKYSGNWIAKKVLKELNNKAKYPLPTPAAITRAATEVVGKTYKSNSNFLWRFGSEVAQGAMLEGSTEVSQEYIEGRLKAAWNDINKNLGLKGEFDADWLVSREEEARIFEAGVTGFLTGGLSSGPSAIVARNEDVEMAMRVARGQSRQFIQSAIEDVKRGKLHPDKFDILVDRVNNFNRQLESLFGGPNPEFKMKYYNQKEKSMLLKLKYSHELLSEELAELRESQKGDTKGELSDKSLQNKTSGIEGLNLQIQKVEELMNMIHKNASKRAKADTSHNISQEFIDAIIGSTDVDETTPGTETEWTEITDDRMAPHDVYRSIRQGVEPTSLLTMSSDEVHAQAEGKTLEEIQIEREQSWEAFKDDATHRRTATNMYMGDKVQWLINIPQVQEMINKGEEVSPHMIMDLLNSQKDELYRSTPSEVMTIYQMVNNSYDLDQEKENIAKFKADYSENSEKLWVTNNELGNGNQAGGKWVDVHEFADIINAKRKKKADSQLKIMPAKQMVFKEMPHYDHEGNLLFTVRISVPHKNKFVRTRNDSSLKLFSDGKPNIEIIYPLAPNVADVKYDIKGKLLHVNKNGTAIELRDGKLIVHSKRKLKYPRAVISRWRKKLGFTYLTGPALNDSLFAGITIESERYRLMAEQSTNFFEMAQAYNFYLQQVKNLEEVVAMEDLLNVRFKNENDLKSFLKEHLTEDQVRRQWNKYRNWIDNNNTAAWDTQTNDSNGLWEILQKVKSPNQKTNIEKLYPLPSQIQIIKDRFREMTGLEMDSNLAHLLNEKAVEALAPSLDDAAIEGLYEILAREDFKNQKEYEKAIQEWLNREINITDTENKVIGSTAKNQGTKKIRLKKGKITDPNGILGIVADDADSFDRVFDALIGMIEDGTIDINNDFTENQSIDELFVSNETELILSEADVDIDSIIESAKEKDNKYKIRNNMWQSFAQAVVNKLVNLGWDQDSFSALTVQQAKLVTAFGVQQSAYNNSDYVPSSHTVQHNGETIQVTLFNKTLFYGIKRQEGTVFYTGSNFDRRASNKLNRFLNQITSDIKTLSGPDSDINSTIDKIKADSTKYEADGATYKHADGRIFSRVTSIVGSMFPDFDANKMSDFVANKLNNQDPSLKITPEEVRDLWSLTTDVGTIMHKIAELVINGFDVNSKTLLTHLENELLTEFDDEKQRAIFQELLMQQKWDEYDGLIQSVKNIINDHPNYTFYSELKIGSDKHGIAGTIDLVAVNNKTGKIKIWDFKTKKIESKGNLYNDPSLTDRRGNINTKDVRKTGKSVLKDNKITISERQANGNIEGDTSGWKVRFNIKNPLTGKHYTNDTVDAEYNKRAETLTKFLLKYFGSSETVKPGKQKAFYYAPRKNGSLYNAFKHLSGGEVGQADFTIYVGSADNMSKFIEDVKKHPEIMELLSYGEQDTDIKIDNMFHARFAGSNIGFKGYDSPLNIFEKTDKESITFYFNGKEYDLLKGDISTNPYIYDKEADRFFPLKQGTSRNSEIDAELYNKLRYILAINMFGEFAAGKNNQISELLDIDVAPIVPMAQQTENINKKLRKEYGGEVTEFTAYGVPNTSFHKYATQTGIYAKVIEELTNKDDIIEEINIVPITYNISYKRVGTPGTDQTSVEASISNVNAAEFVNIPYDNKSASNNVDFITGKAINSDNASWLAQLALNLTDQKNKPDNRGLDGMHRQAGVSTGTRDAKGTKDRMADADQMTDSKEEAEAIKLQNTVNEIVEEMYDESEEQAIDDYGDITKSDLYKFIKQELVRMFPNITLSEVNELIDEKGVEYAGMALGATAFINTRKAKQNTIIHEYLHPWLKLSRRTKIYNAMYDLLKKHPNVEKYMKEGRSERAAVEEVIIEHLQDIVKEKFVQKMKPSLFRKLLNLVKRWFSQIKYMLNRANLTDIMRLMSENFMSAKYSSEDIKTLERLAKLEGPDYQKQSKKKGLDAKREIKWIATQKVIAMKNKKFQLMAETGNLPSNLSPEAFIEMVVMSKWFKLRQKRTVDVNDINNDKDYESFKALYDKANVLSVQTYIQNLADNDSFEESADFEDQSESGFIGKKSDMFAELTATTKSLFYELYDENGKKISLSGISVTMIEAARNAKNVDEFLNNLNALNTPISRAISNKIDFVKEKDEFMVVKHLSNDDYEALEQEYESQLDKGLEDSFETFMFNSKLDKMVSVVDSKDILNATFWEFKNWNLVESYGMLTIKNDKTGNQYLITQSNVGTKKSEVASIVSETVVQRLVDGLIDNDQELIQIINYFEKVFEANVGSGIHLDGTASPIFQKTRKRLYDIASSQNDNSQLAIRKIRENVIYPFFKYAGFDIEEGYLDNQETINKKTYIDESFIIYFAILKNYAKAGVNTGKSDRDTIVKKVQEVMDKMLSEARDESNKFKTINRQFTDKEGNVKNTTTFPQVLGDNTTNTTYYNVRATPWDWKKLVTNVVKLQTGIKTRFYTIDGKMETSFEKLTPAISFMRNLQDEYSSLVKQSETKEEALKKLIEAKPYLKGNPYVEGKIDGQPAFMNIKWSKFNNNGREIYRKLTSIEQAQADVLSLLNGIINPGRKQYHASMGVPGDGSIMWRWNAKLFSGKEAQEQIQKILDHQKKHSKNNMFPSEQRLKNNAHGLYSLIADLDLNQKYIETLLGKGSIKQKAESLKQGGKDINPADSEANPLNINHVLEGSFIYDENEFKSIADAMELKLFDPELAGATEENQNMVKNIVYAALKDNPQARQVLLESNNISYPELKEYESAYIEAVEKLQSEYYYDKARNILNGNALMKAATALQYNFAINNYWMQVMAHGGPDGYFKKNNTASAINYVKRQKGWNGLMRTLQNMVDENGNQRKLKFIVVKDPVKDISKSLPMLSGQGENIKMTEETRNSLGTVEYADSTSWFNPLFVKELQDAIGGNVNNYKNLFKPMGFGPDSNVNLTYLKTATPHLSPLHAFRLNTDRNAQFEQSYIGEFLIENDIYTEEGKEAVLNFAKSVLDGSLKIDGANAEFVNKDLALLLYLQLAGKVDMIIFDSGAKFKDNNAVIENLIDKETGNVFLDLNRVDEFLAGRVLELDTKFLGLQNNPNKDQSDDSLITHSTQKILQIGDGTIANLNRLYELEELYTKNLAQDLDNFIKRYPDKNAMISMLNEIIDVQSNSENIRSFISSDNFNIPGVINTLQSMFGSKFAKKVSKLKVPGSLLVNITDHGTKVWDKKEKQYRDLKWLNPVETKDGITIEPAEVVVTEGSAKIGETVLLTRIPSTGMSLTIPAKVVGLAPADMGPVVMTSAEGFGILGYDTDGDKLFMHKRGKTAFTKAFFDNQWETFMDPDNYNQMTLPIDPELVNNHINHIKDENGNSLFNQEPDFNLFDYYNQTELHEINNHGDTAIGIYAKTYKTFSLLAQENYKLQSPVRFFYKDENGNEAWINLETFDNIADSETGKHNGYSTNLGTQVALDNLNNQQMDKLGMNKYNASIHAMMTSLGYDLSNPEHSFMIAFFRHPAMEGVYESLKRNAKSNIKSQLREEIESMFWDMAQSMSSKDVEMFPDIVDAINNSLLSKKPFPVFMKNIDKLFKHKRIYVDKESLLDDFKNDSYANASSLNVLLNMYQLAKIAEPMFDIGQLANLNKSVEYTIPDIIQTKNYVKGLPFKMKGLIGYVDSSGDFVNNIDRITNRKSIAYPLEAMEKLIGMHSKVFLNADEKFAKAINKIERIFLSTKNRPGFTSSNDVQVLSDVALQMFYSTLFQNEASTNDSFLGITGSSPMAKTVMDYANKLKNTNNLFVDMLEAVPSKKEMINGVMQKIPASLTWNSDLDINDSAQIDQLQADFYKYVEYVSKETGRPIEAIEKGFLRYWFLTENFNGGGYSISKAFYPQMMENIADYYNKNKDAFLDSIVSDPESLVAYASIYLAKNNKYNPFTSGTWDATTKNNGAVMSLTLIDSAAKFPMETAINVTSDSRYLDVSYNIDSTQYGENATKTVEEGDVLVNGKTINDSKVINRDNKYYLEIFSDGKKLTHELSPQKDLYGGWNTINKVSFDQKYSEFKYPNAEIFSAIIRKLQKAFPNIRIKYDESLPVLGRLNAEGEVVLNPKLLRLDTPIHEFGHVFMMVLKQQNKEKYNALLRMAKKSALYNLKKKEYEGESEEKILNEVIATLIGQEGVRHMTEQEQSLFQKVWNAIKNILKYVGIKIGTDKDIKQYTLNDIASKIAADLLSENEISDISSSELAATLEGQSFNQVISIDGRDAENADNRLNSIIGFYNAFITKDKIDLNPGMFDIRHDDGHNFVSFRSKYLASNEIFPLSDLRALHAKLIALQDVLSNHGQVQDQFKDELDILQTIIDTAGDLGSKGLKYELDDRYMDHIEKMFSLYRQHEINYGVYFAMDGYIDASSLNKAIHDEMLFGLNKLKNDNHWTTKMLKWLFITGPFSKYANLYMNPRSMIKLLTGKDNSFLMQTVYNQLSRGKDIKDKFMFEAMNILSGGQWEHGKEGSTFNGVDLTNWEQSTQHEGEIQSAEFKTKKGQVFNISRGDFIKLFMLFANTMENDLEDHMSDVYLDVNGSSIRLSKRSSAYVLWKNGITFVDAKNGKDTKIKFTRKAKDGTLKSNGLLQEMLKTWNDDSVWENAADNQTIVDSFRDYLDNYAYHQVNDTYKRLHGIDIQQFKNYFPQTQDIEEGRKKGKIENYLENLSFLMYRHSAEHNNPIKLTGALDTMQTLIEKQANYVAYAMPVRNMRRLIDGEKQGPLYNMLAKHNNPFGDKMEEFYKRFFDLSRYHAERETTNIEARKLANSWMQRIWSAFTLSKLGFGYFTSLKGLGGIFIASGEIDHKYIRMASKHTYAKKGLKFLNPKHMFDDNFNIHPEAIEEMKAIGAYQLVTRLEGMTTVEIGELNQQITNFWHQRRTGFKVMGKMLPSKPGGINFNQQAAMAGIQNVDRAHTITLFLAAKYEIMDKYNIQSEDVKDWSEAYKQELRNRSTEIVTKTQPMFEAKDRAFISMMQDNLLARIVTLFGSQHSANFNGLISKLVDVQNDPSAKNKKMLKHMFLGATVFNATWVTAVMLAKGVAEGKFECKENIENCPEIQDFVYRYSANYLSESLQLFYGASYVSSALNYINSLREGSGYRPSIISDPITETADQLMKVFIDAPVAWGDEKKMSQVLSRFIYSSSTFIGLPTYPWTFINNRGVKELVNKTYVPPSKKKKKKMAKGSDVIFY